MGQFFFKVDQWLIGLATRISHSWQRLSGLTNFWVARVLGLGYVLVMPYLLLSVTLNVNKQNVRLMSFVIAIYGLFMLIGISSFQRQSRLFREMEEHYMSGNSAAHWRTLVWQRLWRLRMTRLVQNSALFTLYLWSFRSGTPTTIMVLFVGVYSNIAADFFSVVIPLPPGNSKLRKLLDDWSLFWIPSPALQDA